MKTLYLECQMGAAGDMLMGALWELLPRKEEFLQVMNSLPGISVTPEQVQRCCVTGTHMSVKIHGQEEDEHSCCHGHHSHTTMADITAALAGLAVSPWVKEQARAVYGRIAQAESQVHGTTVEAVHFHEVGAWDAVADVVGVCLALEQLEVSSVCASPIHVGSGQVRCAHGILPVPAPATALILRGVPIYGGEIQGELCTPTGAALLTQFVRSFGPMPEMTVSAMGYGMGSKDFPRANCVRAFLGETQEQPGSVTELSCNLDDMTPEALGFAQELLLEAGALDVWTIPIGMKKCRPGVLLQVLCQPEDADFLAQLLFRHTTTLGIRSQSCSRYTLERSMRLVETEYGPIRVKDARGYGVRRTKAEYEDLARTAREQGLPLEDVRKLIL